MIEKTFRFASTLSVLAALSACGGGGGGGTTPAPAATGVVVAPVVISTASTIVISAPAPTYAAGSEELAAFNKLNVERTFCGFGALAQSAALDKAAKAHADWTIANNYTSGHFEVSGTLGFTGVTVSDRVVAAGYSTANLFTASDENTEVVGVNLKTGVGYSRVRGLLNAPYHAAGLMSGFRDVGFSVRNATDVASTFGARVMLQVNPAYKTTDGPQLLAANEVNTYPCDNSSDVEPNLLNESPNPVPGRDLAKNPLGSSVYIAVRDGNTITIGSATMTNLATGMPVTLRTAVTAVNDPNKPNGVSYLKSNQSFVSADSPLSPNTKHQVVVTGTNNGIPFNRNFTFTTGLAS